MFSTTIGLVHKASNQIYLRPETAQAMDINKVENIVLPPQIPNRL